MAYLIVLDAPTGMQRKLVRVFLEHEGAYRQIERNVPQAVDVEAFIQANFAQLWAAADPLAEHEWVAASEAAFGELYRTVARAAVRAFQDGATDLTDITDAMEAEISASGRSGAYSQLKSMAASATAAQRDAFFLATSFIVLGQTAGK